MHPSTLKAIVNLRSLGKKNGFVTRSEISDFLPTNVLSPMQINAIVNILKLFNINVIEANSSVENHKTTNAQIITKRSKINLNKISLKSFVKNNDIPIRIKNAIASESDYFDFGTLHDFLNNNDNYDLLRRTPNLGKGSIDQLTTFINNFVECNDIIESTTTENLEPIKEKFFIKKIDTKINESISNDQAKSLKGISIGFFANNSMDLDVRTRNCLIEAEKNKSLERFFENLYDLYVAPSSIKNLLTNLPNFGKHSKAQLNVALKNLIEDEELLLNYEILCNEAPETLSDYESIEDLMENEISQLNSEKIIKVLNFRFLKKKRLTLEEVGIRFDVTRERIRQIESKGLSKINASLAMRFTEDQIIEWSRNKLENFFFTKNSFISLKTATRLLKEESEPTYHNLFIKVYSKNLEHFLNSLFIYNKKYNGWFLHNEVDQNYINIESRVTIVEALLKARWPIKLSALASDMMLPEAVTLDFVLLSNNLEIYTIINESYIRYKKLKSSEAVRLAIGNFKQGANFIELQEFIKEAFDLDLSTRSVQVHLDYFSDAIMIERAQYSKYILIDNLNLSPEEMELIKQYAINYLIKKQEFIAASIIFKNLSKGNNLLISNPLMSSYVLYEICKIDSRFLSGRGAMLGLIDENFKGEFVPLIKEYVNLMNKFGRPLTITEIIKELSPKRDLLDAAVYTQLNNDIHGIFVKIGNGFYLNDLQNRSNRNTDELWELEFDDI